MHPWAELQDFGKVVNVKDYTHCQVQEKVLSGALPSMERIPGSFSNLIKSCWALDPNKRPTFSEVTKELNCNALLKSLTSEEKQVTRFGISVHSLGSPHYLEWRSDDGVG